MSGRAEISRRSFLIAGAGAAIAASGLGLYRGSQSTRHISGSILGASSGLGHMMRDGKLPQPQSESRMPTVIVGGGMAGLSAAWAFSKHGYQDFTILELEDDLGGNSRFGRNAVSAYPWGAHYVPVPGKDAALVRTLFEELSVIDSYAGGKPHFRDEYLCAAPEERLHIYGAWQEGLIPAVGVAAEDERQYAKFHALMEDLKEARGSDGKKAFTIPLELSSADEKFRSLDALSMAQYLDKNALTSVPLRWYVNYCCLDDFGAGIGAVSAWAGIHYFAARDAWAINAEEHDLLTWPAGNGWIVDQLSRRLGPQVRKSALVFNIEENGSGMAVDFYSPAEKTSQRILCDEVLYAAPRFSAPYVIPALRESRPAYLSRFEYGPWMVANVTLSSLPSDSPQGLAWDNVFYHSSSLGYVNATHQEIGRTRQDTVVTYYRPLVDMPPRQARQAAYARTWEEWRDITVSDLKAAHRDIVPKIASIEVWLWGHAMIRPAVGLLWSEERAAAARPFGKIYFAHSDMSAMSIFEEAQYQGVRSAEHILRARAFRFSSLL